MNAEALGFALLLIAALCGWSWFLVRISIARVEDAKAFEILDRVSAKIDSRVQEVVAIALKRMQQTAAGVEDSKGTATSRILDDEGEAMREMRRKMQQGPTGIRVFDETAQAEPESDLGEMPVGVEG